MKRTRILSMIMALMLCLSLLPAAALATDEPALDVVETAELIDVVDETEEVTEIDGKETELEEVIEPAEEVPILAEEAIPEIAVADEAAQAAEGVPISESNFPDANFRSYIAEVIDDDLDGYLSDEELAIETIDCHDLGIASLEGIELFKNLRTLACGYNMLDDLSVRYNTKLQALMAPSCGLTWVDLSYTPDLYRVNLTGNDIDTLNLEPCAMLLDLAKTVTPFEIPDTGCFLYEDSYEAEDGNTYNRLLMIDPNTTLLPQEPSIVKQPQDYTVVAGRLAFFQVYANYVTEFQWQTYDASTQSWENITDSRFSGVNTRIVGAEAALDMSGMQFRCILNGGELITNAATLTVVRGKPTITNQPVDQTAVVGSTASFSLVSDDPGASYRWEFFTEDDDGDGYGLWSDVTDPEITGANASTLIVPATIARNGMKFRCTVSNTYGGSVSYAVQLTVTVEAPAIQNQPTSQTATTGDKATFKVVASGSDLTYQWQYKTSAGKWANITSSIYTGVKTATMKVNATSGRDGMQYRCKITNSAGTVYSKTVTLTVISKPTITTQPTNKSVNDGSKATFKVVADGYDLAYQWQYKTSAGKWASITSSKYTGTDTATMKVPATLSRDGLQFRCKITNSAGTVYSNVVKLTVKAIAPKITTQPTSQSVKAGSTVAFKVGVSNSDVTYQWQYKTSAGKWAKITSSKYTGTDAATMKVPATLSRDGLQFRCKITNSAGTSYSNVVKLTVKAA